MFEDLIGTQVNASTRLSLDLLKFMYPSFKIVKTEFDIFPGQPFIYIGDLKWINKIKSHKEPYIIVSSTGEYDLTDRHTLMEIAYKKHNKTIPKYIEDLGLLKSPREGGWSDDDFIYNWKYVWLLGTTVDKEVDRSNMFYSILENLSIPANLTTKYLELLDKEGTTDGADYLDRALISFIKKSRNISQENTKNQKMLAIRHTFTSSYSQFVPQAILNMLESPIEYQPLKLLNFMLDITWSRR